MFAFVAFKPEAVAPRAALLSLAVLIAPALSGCGSSQSASSSTGPAVMSWRLSDEGAQARPPSQPRDMEDDGIPAQTPPMKDIRNHKDDPSQPWSPNYGRVKTANLQSKIAETADQDGSSAALLSDPQQAP
jgi:hypothetical protein